MNAYDENLLKNAVANFAKKVDKAHEDWGIMQDYTYEGYTQLIEIQTAKRFYKLWWTHLDGTRQSIHSFIDKTTGDIYKPASTQAHAKHARGNVLSASGGAEALSGYSVRYL